MRVPARCKFDQDQIIPRPDFCLGTDEFHTPSALISRTSDVLKEMGYKVGINRPYQGTLVPLNFLNQNSRVISMMIEVNRSLYMDEKSGDKKANFIKIKEQILVVLHEINQFFQQQADC